MNAKQTQAAINRINKAVAYLKQHDIDVFSRTDNHYLAALHIAAGYHVPDAGNMVTNAKQNKVD